MFLGFGALYTHQAGVERFSKTCVVHAAVNYTTTTKFDTTQGVCANHQWQSPTDESTRRAHL